MFIFAKIRWPLALSLTFCVGAATRAVAAERADDALPAGALMRFGTRRFRHEGATFSVAFSPDNKVVAAGASDGKVYLWETNTGKQIRRLDIGGFNGCYPGIAFSPDGKRLAITGYDLSVWDVASGKKLFRQGVAMHLGYGPAAKPVFFSPDGKRLYVPAHAKDKKVGVTVIDATTGVELHQIGVTNERIDSIALSADGKTMALGLHDWTVRNSSGVVRLLDVAADKVIREFPSPKGVSHLVWAVAFSPEGKTVAWVEKDRIILGNVKDGKQVGTLDATATRLLFTPDGKMLLSDGPDSKIYFWDLARRKRVRELDGRMGGTRGLALSRDGRFVAVGSSGCTIRVWEIKSGRELGAQRPGHDSVVAAFSFSPDGKTLLSGDPHQQVCLWDTTSGRLRRSWRTGGGALAFSHDGKCFASASRNAWPIWAAKVDPIAHLWDVVTGKEMCKLAHETGQEVCALAFAQDDETLITTTTRTAGGVPPPGNTSLHLWNVANGQRLRTPTPLAGAIASAGILSADGRILASGYTSIGSFSVKDGRQIRTVPGTKRWRLLALSGDGKLLAARTFEDGPFQPDWENAIYVWETATGKEILRKPLEGGLSFAFSPTGRFAAVVPDGWASRRGVKRDTSFRICLYDLSSGKEVRQFRPDGGHIASLAFSPDGSRLASGLGNGTVLLWDVSAMIAAVRPKGELSAEEQTRLWSDLASADACKAYAAIWALADHQRRTVPYLRERVAPITVVKASRLSKLIADLDSDQFAIRERAAAELEKMTDAAEPALRNALRHKPTLEARRRIELLLAKRESRPLSSDRLRALRAVTVLEQIGDNGARPLLEKLATGQPDVSLTREAKAALDRLAARGR